MSETKSHMSEWFRSEYGILTDKGITGDALRLAMYIKGINYLKHIAQDTGTRKRDMVTALKMIENSQGWIDRTEQNRNKSNEQGEPAALSKQQIRNEFSKNPDSAFAVAYRLVQKAAAEDNPGERIQLIGEVAKEFDVDISDFSY